MRALRFVEIRKSAYVDIEMPCCPEDQVMIEVMAAGICHSDVMAYEGKHPFRIPPVITGHEFSGIVREIGPRVEGFAIGDRVVVEPHVGCGKCENCIRGNSRPVVEKKLIGVGDWTGCFGEYVLAYPGMCLHIPDSMGFEEAAALEPYCVGEHAVGLVDAQRGDSALIIGSGTIGMMTLLSLKNHGVETIFISDISSVKRDLGLSLGATGSVNPMSEDLNEKIMAGTNGAGVDHVFICAPVPSVLNQSLSVMKKKGKLVVIAVFDCAVEIAIKILQMHEKVLLGSNMYTIMDFKHAIELYNSGKLNISPLITKNIGFHELAETINKLAQGELQNEVKIQVIY